MTGAGPTEVFPGRAPGGTDGQGTGVTRARVGRSHGGRKKALIVAAGIAAAAAAVAAAAVVVLHSHSAVKHTAQPAKPTPTTSPAGPPPKPPNNIDNVETDPKPITRVEIFPDSMVSVGGRQFVRVATAVNDNCALSARGSFARALTADNCERVVRATYVDNSKRFAVTAGVAALPSKTLAERANRAKRLSRNVWFVGLDGKAGRGAQLISKSGGYAYGVIDGRYIIFAYATYSNGRMPTGKSSTDHVVESLSRSFAMLVERPITARAQGL